ncbi:hypothetical protein [Luteibacter rhizovicinus]|uniref:hypothetical protein n=1 Tax=Luteibacter rhizovicinus TaxID=242606 RepID=UPI001053C54F|nr:hypothetical protein [Luteibacter rhizovicinus]
MMKSLATTISLAFCLIATSASACDFASARYQHSADANLHASFKVLKLRPAWPTDLALDIRDEKTSTSFWFLFDAGASSYVSLISTADVTAKGWTPPSPDGGIRPLGSMHIFMWNKDMRIADTVPEAQGQAPETFFVPDLTESLRHTAKPPLQIDQGFFKLVSCSK